MSNIKRQLSILFILIYLTACTDSSKSKLLCNDNYIDLSKSEFSINGKEIDITSFDQTIPIKDEKKVFCYSQNGKTLSIKSFDLCNGNVIIDAELENVSFFKLIKNDRGLYQVLANNYADGEPKIQLWDLEFEMERMMRLDYLGDGSEFENIVGKENTQKL
ncbi:hypothetical protein [Flammeovirga aprica]|uniref:Uncharacterized protein n=1 Tax=Flammeovirga aprica JL-4 TaxID=694437 RepID=A0A7X9S208_9BACT|nr:hypothetical protein [Flammeovirga aprica]NME72918.1 hypothetical protein [Flammeovirga aprica JL-4]